MNKSKNESLGRQKVEKFHTLSDVSRFFGLPQVEIDVSVNPSSDYPQVREALQAMIVAAIEKGKASGNGQRKRAKSE